MKLVGYRENFDKVRLKFILNILFIILDFLFIF